MGNYLAIARAVSTARPAGWSVAERQQQRARAAGLVADVMDALRHRSAEERPDAATCQRAQQAILDALVAEDGAGMDEALAQYVCLLSFEQRQRAAALARNAS